MKDRPTIHFVYIRGSGIAAPLSITSHVAQRLAGEYSVKVYDWLEQREIQPETGDILLGHPHPDPTTIFQRSFQNQRFAKRIVMSPLAHAMPEYIAFLDPIIDESDWYLAIAGKYWIDTLDQSLVSHWGPKILHLDLAVDRGDYPRIKGDFNPPGQRKFLYIGSTGRNKGTDLYSRLADRLPHYSFGWIGSGPSMSRQVRHHGPADFSTQTGRDLVTQYDFLVHMGRSDANPTTILECAAWGLLPACSPTSGYINEPWIARLSTESLDETAATLEGLQQLTDQLIEERRDLAAQRLMTHFNWDRFYSDVLRAIRDPGRHAGYEPDPTTIRNKRRLQTLARRKRRQDLVLHHTRRASRAFLRLKTMLNQGWPS